MNYNGNNMILEDMSMSEIVIVILIAVAITIFVFFSYPPKSNVKLEEPPPNSVLLSVVQEQLKAKGAILYGTSWGGFTVKQLNEIGGRNHVTYIDCAEDGNKELCESEGIQAYPTWKINGQMYSGYYSIETLAQMIR